MLSHKSVNFHIQSITPYFNEIYVYFSFYFVFGFKKCCPSEKINTIQANFLILSAIEESYFSDT